MRKDTVDISDLILILLEHMQYTAAYLKHGELYIGWIEEVPGVNTQGKTLKELKDNLKEALSLVLKVSKSILAKERPRGKVVRERIRI